MSEGLWLLSGLLLSGPSRLAGAVATVGVSTSVVLMLWKQLREAEEALREEQPRMEAEIRCPTSSRQGKTGSRAAGQQKVQNGDEPGTISTVTRIMQMQIQQGRNATDSTGKRSEIRKMGIDHDQQRRTQGPH
ncbi:hypothetical protein FPQ18DRAFT_301043 [Pyronema domesticum]|nr:hypothetical protein FPQ18DRAFT_301043 [Pyronema domesticum]